MRRWLLAAALLLAQEKQDPRPYKPMGAPADPKVPAQWNRYRDYEDATRLLKELARVHPERARLASLGTSYGDREMWLLTITSFAKGKEEEKPAFYIDGGIHANELQGPEVVLYTAWYLLEMYGRAPFITRLVDERVFYLVPMMSPDSRDAHMHKPNTTHSPRSGQRPVDDDRDGLVDEDTPDDLDGDGSITQMRVKDPNGRWKPHKDFPELMVECGPDERGEYRMLGSEGVDNDGDGLVNEDGDGFYDPNRDWAWNWQPAHAQWGAHRYPFSILENRRVANFVMAHPNIAGAQSFHNSGGMILRGPGAKDDRYEGADVAVYDAIGRKGEAMLPAYRYLDVAYGLYEVYGGELDWFYAMQGIFTFSNELFTPFNLFRRPEGGREDAHLFNKHLLFQEGFAAWKEVRHPQYGVVEVGGFRKEWMRQPPSFLLEEECHRNMAFTLYHADQMPQVKVQKVEARELGDGLTEVTAVIANPKVIPTRAAVDVKNRISPPDRVTITAKDLKVVVGLHADNPWFQRAEEQKRHPQEVHVPSIGSMGAVYVRWIVKGAGPYTVTARSAKGGVDEARR
jgi:hypothetical protein